MSEQVAKTSFHDTTAEIVKRLRTAKPRIGYDDEDANPRDLMTDAADEIERWKNLAQHLCYKAGHGPKRHALDPNRCGRCERVLG